MAREIISKTENFTSKDLFNAHTANQLQDLEDGTTIKVDAIGIFKAPDMETGEEKEVACFKSGDEYFTSISATVIESAEDLIDVIKEDGPQNVKLIKRKSRAGRTFLSLMLL